MASRAWVGDAVRVSFSRRDEAERMGTNVHIGNGLLNLRHMAANTLATRAARLVMRMLLDRSGMRPVLGIGAMTGEAHLAWRLAQLRPELGTVHIMATEAGYPAVVHEALNKVIALHAIFVRCAVGEM